jgi:hypothetical protein
MKAKQIAIGIRLGEDEKAAMQLAADKQDRKVASLARIILVGWLRTNGFLPTPPEEAEET